jgi:hypothetical protein
MTDGFPADEDCDAFYASVEELDRPELKYVFISGMFTDVDIFLWALVKES